MFLTPDTYPRRARCGDLVYDTADPRHVGRVDAISSLIWARVTWLETGWTSEMKLANLREAPKGG
jgi:hypothetical protein